MAVVPVASVSSLAEDLLESDAAYFESGAILEPFEGAVLARLSGLEHIAPGAVLQRIQPHRIGLSAERWISAAESFVRARKVTRLRLYLTQSHPRLERTLRTRDYAERKEIGMIRSTHEERRALTALPKVRLEEVVDMAGWDEKRRIQEACATGADGHAVDPRGWLEMERRRAAHGYMRPFLIRHGSTVCGALNLAPRGTLLRLKNLVLHPNWRGKGMALAAVAAVTVVGREAGFLRVGCFVNPGRHVHSVYELNGFIPIVTQTEWMQR